MKHSRGVGELGYSNHTAASRALNEHHPKVRSCDFCLLHLKASAVAFDALRTGHLSLSLTCVPIETERYQSAMLKGMPELIRANISLFQLPA